MTSSHDLLASLLTTEQRNTLALVAGIGEVSALEVADRLGQSPTGSGVRLSTLVRLGLLRRIRPPMTSGKHKRKPMKYAVTGAGEIVLAMSRRET